MNYQEHLDYLLNNSKINIHNYIKNQNQIDTGFDWFKITPELKTQEGENTCLFYKLLFDDFNVSKKYITDIFYSLSNNHNQVFSIVGLNIFCELKDVLTPFKLEHFARRLTESKTMSDLLDIDIFSASSNEIYIKGLLARFYNNSNFKEEKIKEKDLYNTFDNLAILTLNPIQQNLVNETINKIEFYRATTNQKQDNVTKEYIIEYMENPNLMTNNDLAIIALLKPFFKYSFTQACLPMTDDKKMIIQSLSSNSVFQYQEIFDSLVGKFLNSQEEIQIIRNDSHLIEILLNITQIATVNQKCLENKIALEKDYLSNIIDVKDKVVKSKKHLKC
jgi:hypothetical protein